ncbi:MAG: DUF790 family protein [Blastocatellia bacterium]
MLTADLVISWQRKNKTGPRYLDAGDGAHLQTAGDLIGIVAQHTGARRAELEQALGEYVGTGTDYRILRGLIKLLLDRCVLSTLSEREPEQIRRTLFLAARARHPVIDDDIRQQVMAEAAGTLEIAPESVAEGLFADLSDNERLADFDQPEPRALLEQYNLAQAQALLYRCVEMTLRVDPQEPAGYRQMFQAIKRYGLIHTIQGDVKKGYEIRLSGPVSLFHRSQKYGIQMAVFLPALLQCRAWSMSAEIESKKGTAFFELSAAQTDIVPPPLWDDTGENPAIEKFMTNWARQGVGWTAALCREVIDLDGTAFAPDVVLTEAEGRRVWVEFFGFWTPKYLQQRLAEFARAGFRDFVLLMSDELRGSREAPDGLPPNVVSYKSSPDARAVLRAISV